MSKVTKVLIVDDHPIVQHGLTKLIEAEPDLKVCGVAESVTQALKVNEETDPDVALIDISLRNGSGIDLIKKIKDLENPVRVIVVSIRDQKLYGEMARDAGAMGYVCKHEDIENISIAIRRVLDGKTYFDS